MRLFAQKQTSKQREYIFIKDSLRFFKKGIQSYLFFDTCLLISQQFVIFWKKTRHKKNRSKVTNILSKMPNWKLPKIETNFTNFEVWSTKIELPKIEITNIERYQYQGIPVPITFPSAPR